MGTDAAWTRRVRLLRVLIGRGRITTRRAAQLLGVERRMARDDLEALAEYGVPLGHEGEGRDRVWVLEPTWHEVGLPVGLQGRLALLFGRELVGSFLHDTDFADAIERLDEQLSALDPQADLREDVLRRRFYYVHEPKKDYRAHRKTLDRLVQAILEGYRVTVAYRPAGAAEPRTYERVAPLTLIIYKRGVYLLFERRDRYYRLAVERMDGVEPHPDAPFDYPRPAEYDPREVLRHCYGIFDDGTPPAEVRLRCAPGIRFLVEGRQWARDQRIEPRDDGGCDLVFSATGPELVSLVLQWGDKVEVIGPPWLRERVRRELAGALARYGEG